MKTILIVGATGIVGDAALSHFCAAPHWHVLAEDNRLIPRYRSR
jgi:nucleoside-diphosphate-sugar epimerase